jgi:hypothetical protein
MSLFIGILVALVVMYALIVLEDKLNDDKK